MNNSKTRILKSLNKVKKLKNSFITDNRINNHVSFKSVGKNNINNNSIESSMTSFRKHFRAKTNKLNQKKASETINTDNDNKSNDNDNLNPNDYEDLFFFFLLHLEKIDYFENILMQKKERRINHNYYFMNIFDSLTGEKTYWNNFYFPKYVYMLFYLKSRILQKEIIKYSISKGKEIMDVINSYNKKYTSFIQIKNWKLKPAEAYTNYEKINKSRKAEIENKNKNNLSKITNFTDFVIRTDNRGKGKTLIFLGKTINIYIDDIEKYQNKNNGISMAAEDSEFNTKVKNEVVYTFDDVAIKNFKGNSTVNNKHINKIKINFPKKENNLNLSKEKFKKINKTIKGLNLKNPRFKYKDKFININNRKIKRNIFNNYMKDSNKLPLIKLSKKKFQENTELNDSKKAKNNLTFLQENKIKKLFKQNELKKKIKINFNSLYNFDSDERKNNNKTIINFFSKKDNDFYYY